MKKQISKIIAVAIVVTTLALSLSACANKKTVDPAANSSFVNLDINPNIDLVVDVNNKVIGIVANNEDAETLLVGTKLIGKDAVDAVDEIICLSFSMGYINKNNTDVKVVAVAPSGEVNENLEKIVVENIKKTADNVQKNLVETEKIAVDVLSDISNSVNRRCENFKKQIADGNNNSSVKNATRSLKVGKFLVMEKAVKLSDGELTMEQAVTMNVEELNKSIYNLNSNCEVVVANLSDKIQDGAMDLIEEHQGIIDNIYDEINDLNVKHQIIFRKAYYKAQKELINTFDKMDDVINMHKQMFFEEPVSVSGQEELSKIVDKITDEIFTEQTEKDAFKVALKNKEDKYTYYSVALGLESYLDTIIDVTSDKTAIAINNALDAIEALTVTVKNIATQAINLAYETSKTALNIAINAYVSGVNIANKAVNLPEIVLPTEEFKTFKDMRKYIVSTVEIQTANMDKALTDITDKYLSNEQKAEIKIHRENVENAYKKSYENYNSKLQSIKDALIKA